MQQRPYGRKVNVTHAKFMEFCMRTDWNVSLSFSGGADSSVLLDMFANHWSSTRDCHGNKPLLVIYANTSNEFASMPSHVERYVKYIEEKYDIKIDLEKVRAKQNYFDVVRTEGYPVVSKKVSRMVRDVRNYLTENNINYLDIKNKIKRYDINSAEYLRRLGFPKTIVLRLTGITSEDHICKSWCIPKKWLKLIDTPFNVSEKCCDILKKEPMKLVQKASKANPIFGTLAEDSEQRREAYLQTGCNSFKGNGKGQSTPMGFWLRQDVLRYIKENDLPIAPVYGDIIELEDGTLEFTGEHNTGCKLCLFGCHLEKDPNRIKRLKTVEPATYKFAMKSLEDGGLGYKEIMSYCGINYE